MPIERLIDDHNGLESCDFGCYVHYADYKANMHEVLTSLKETAEYLDDVAVYLDVSPILNRASEILEKYKKDFENDND